MMKPERWQQAREVLADALELKPEDRPAFLDRVCSSDNSLRREVERLLSSSGEAKSSFLESSALRVTLMPGTKLGEYEVQKLIGSGGMGEVYRARDTRLGRDVAIKVLPSFLSQDSDRLRRFEQEARAAAALNHPNILAVFQMGTYEGAPYLVSELLEGGTLREQLVRGPMPLRKAIDCGGTSHSRIPFRIALIVSADVGFCGQSIAVSPPGTGFLLDYASAFSDATPG
jgi:serine/threonine protein kinase